MSRMWYYSNSNWEPKKCVVIGLETKLNGSETASLYTMNGRGPLCE